MHIEEENYHVCLYFIFQRIRNDFCIFINFSDDKDYFSKIFIFMNVFYFSPEWSLEKVNSKKNFFFLYCQKKKRKKNNFEEKKEKLEKAGKM